MNIFKQVLLAGIFACLMIGSFGTASAQRLEADKVLRNWSVTVHGGMTTPFTDIRMYDWYRVTDPVSEYQYGVGASVTRMFGSIFGANVDYTFGKLQGVARDQPDIKEDRQIWEQIGMTEPGFFNTYIHHVSGNVYINWSNMFLGLNRVMRAKIKDKPINERRFSVFSRLGVGALFFESEVFKADVENPEDEIPIDNAKYLRGYTGKATEVTFPMSIGLKVKVTKAFDIGLEQQFTFVNTDKLDAWNDNSVRARNDRFSYTNLNFTFKFGGRKAQKEHLEWINPLEAYMDETNTRLDNLEDITADDDGDGIMNGVDEEDDTPEGAIVDSHGRTQDSDGDGCPDHEDPEPFSSPLLPIEDCANVWEDDSLSEAELAQVKEMITQELKAGGGGGRGWAMEIIFFDLDKADIRPSEIPELYKMATLMKKYPDMKVNVRGHADVRYTDEYNQALSERRTGAAIDYIVNRWGIARDRFIAGSFGEKENLFPNATKEAQHWLNRRVEFTPADDVPADGTAPATEPAPATQPTED